jgi:hypothetical protein
MRIGIGICKGRWRDGEDGEQERWKDVRCRRVRKVNEGRKE